MTKILTLPIQNEVKKIKRYETEVDLKEKQIYATIELIEDCIRKRKFSDIKYHSETLCVLAESLEKEI